MKAWIVATVLLGVIGLGFASQDLPPEAERLVKCNLKTVQPMYWCATDQAFVEADAVEKPDKKDKKAKPHHKGTDHELELKRACIQVFYRCQSHSQYRTRKPGACKDKECKTEMEKITDVKMFVYKCIGCGASSVTEKKDLKHNTTEEHLNRVIETCAGAGRFPHVMQD